MLVVVFDQNVVVPGEGGHVAHAARPVLVVHAVDVCFGRALDGQVQTPWEGHRGHLLSKATDRGAWSAEGAPGIRAAFCTATISQDEGARAGTFGGVLREDGEGGGPVGDAVAQSGAVGRDVGTAGVVHVELKGRLCHTHT